MTKQPDGNMRFWDQLRWVPQEVTKAFKRKGGFSGNDINPTWRMQRMTEVFGPCGVGWGTTEPKLTFHAAGDDILVYCVLGVWIDGGTTVWGVGGDYIASKNKQGAIVTDDEACKKAQTDAIGNAMQKLGLAADVWLGNFDDSKYQEKAQAELFKQEAQRDPDFDRHIAKSNALRTDLLNAGDLAELEKVGTEIKKAGLPAHLVDALRNEFAQRRVALQSQQAQAAE